jgi:helix-turn-helix protein
MRRRAGPDTLAVCVRAVFSLQTLEGWIMSHQGTNWAIQQRGLKPTSRIVLWHLCDRYNPDYGCFPSQARLAYDCEISRAGLNTHLAKLEQRGLLRRVRRVDPITKRQMSTRYILGFEEDFGPFPRGRSDPTIYEITPFDPENPCPDSGHGRSADKQNESSILKGKCVANLCLETGHRAVSRKPPDPCPENDQSRVQILDTNLVKEPLSKPVKEEEDAQAREGLSDLFFGKLLKALGFQPDGALPAWWQGPSAKAHVQRWRGDLGLTEVQIIEVAEETRLEHPDPPDGPKALDRFMERAARCDAQSASLGERFRKGRRAREKTSKPHGVRNHADRGRNHWACLPRHRAEPDLCRCGSGTLATVYRSDSHP